MKDECYVTVEIDPEQRIDNIETKLYVLDGRLSSYIKRYEEAEEVTLSMFDSLGTCVNIYRRTLVSGLVILTVCNVVLLVVNLWHLK